MKTLFLITIILFLNACGTNTTTKSSSITPPQPSQGGADIKPPTSPTLP